jgi:hypothetical protein
MSAFTAAPLRSWFNWRRYRPFAVRQDVRDTIYLHRLKKERMRVGRCPDRYWEDGTQCSFPVNHTDHYRYGDTCHMDYDHGGGFGWINEGEPAIEGKEK